MSGNTQKNYYVSNKFTQKKIWFLKISLKKVFTIDSYLKIWFTN